MYFLTCIITFAIFSLCNSKTHGEICRKNCTDCELVSSFLGDSSFDLILAGWNFKDVVKCLAHLNMAQPVTAIRSLTQVESQNIFSQVIFWPSDVLENHIDQLRRLSDRLTGFKSIRLVFISSNSTITDQLFSGVPGVNFPISTTFLIAKIEKVNSLNEVRELKRVYTIKNATFATNYGEFSYRENFHGITLNVSVKDDAAENSCIQFRRRNPEPVLSKGYCVSILSDLSYLLNFKSNVIISEKAKEINNKLQGKVITDLNSGRIDIIINPKTMLPYRARQLQFMTPVEKILIMAFFQQPKANSLKNFVTAPFELKLWLVYGGMWIIIITSIKLLVTLSRAAGIQNLEEKDNQFSNDPFYWALASACQKSWWVLPESKTLRIAFFFGSVISIVSYTAYSATIVSTLSTVTTPVKRFEDLIKYKFTFTVHEKSQALRYFVETMIEGRSLQQKVELVNTRNEITHVTKSSNAFIAYPVIWYKVAKDQNFTKAFLCEHTDSLPATMTFYKGAMYLKKHSPLVSTLNMNTVRMTEVGLMAKYDKNWHGEAMKSCPVVTPKPTKVRFDEVFTTFTILVIGAFLSIALLGFEKIRKLKK